MIDKPGIETALKEAKIEILKLIVGLYSKNVDTNAIMEIFSLEKQELEQIESLVHNFTKNSAMPKLNRYDIDVKALNMVDLVKKEQKEEIQTNSEERASAGRLNKELREAVKRNVRNPNQRRITTVPVTMKTRLTKENERLIKLVSSLLGYEFRI